MLMSSYTSTNYVDALNLYSLFFLMNWFTVSIVIEFEICIMDFCFVLFGVHFTLVLYCSRVVCGSFFASYYDTVVRTTSESDNWLIRSINVGHAAYFWKHSNVRRIITYWNCTKLTITSRRARFELVSNY